MMITPWIGKNAIGILNKIRAMLLVLRIMKLDFQHDENLQALLKKSSVGRLAFTHRFW